MHPEALRIGWFTISSYGVAMAVAFLTTVWLASKAADGPLRGVVPMSGVAVSDWACWGIVGGILGGRAFYVAANWDGYGQSPWEIIAVWHGGLIWYGGFIGGVVATALFMRRHNFPFLRGVDQVIPFVALGHAIGRIGCFLNGCCYGKPTSSWCGVRFPGQPVPVVPTQLFEAAGLAALYWWLRRLQTPERLRRPGTVFGAYLVAYGLLRAVIEFWRDQQPIGWFGLTWQQWISAGIAAVGVVLLARSRRLLHA